MAKKPSKLIITSDSKYTQSTNTLISKFTKHRKTKIILIAALVVLALVYLLRNYQGKLIVAKVNGQPVYRLELNQRLTSQYGAQVLEMLIGEKLILNEAKKQNLTLTPAEIQKSVTEIEKSLGGMSLDESLKIRDLTRNEFEQQLSTQLLIEKMLAKDATVSTSEIDEYLKTNTDSITASTEAEKKAEAEASIRRNKIGQLFLDWFNKLKDAAKIDRYL